MEVFIRPDASPLSSSFTPPVAAMVSGTFENMKPVSPTTMPVSTKRRPSVSDISVISSTPAPSSMRPRVATGRTPKRVTSRPATSAAGTDETVMGAKRRPAASGPCPSTS
jgi:hypothetical protein